MNQLREIVVHLKESHQETAVAASALKRLEAWKNINFVTEETLDVAAKLEPGILKDPKELLKNPMVRASVLSRGILEGAT